MLLLISLRTRDKKGAKIKLSPTSAAPAVERVEEPEKAILCKNCDQLITSRKLAIEPQGKTFINPLGISFNVFCYSDAPGARDIGSPTLDDTWFDGYAWSFARCVRCDFHLGWWFVGPGRFIGLIAARIVG